MNKLTCFSLVLLALFQLSFAHREFFPDWRNCKNDPTIEIIDLYFDHQPKPNSPNNTLTICAGKGKELAIDDLHIVITKDGQNVVYDSTIPEVHGMIFAEGKWSRCLDTVIPEFSENGNYTMAAEMYINDQGLVGCVSANWHLARSSSFRLESF